MRSEAAAAALLAALLAPAAAHADAAAGKAKAATVCQTCHGMDGLGTNPTVPNIAGDSPTYIVEQLTDFRSGQRQHEQMSIIAQMLSDDDIRNLADYFAAIKVTATVPDL